MRRMTRKRKDGACIVEPHWAHVADDGAIVGLAVDRLAAYEDAQETIERQLESTVAKLDDLRAAGKIRSATAQQLLAQKLAYSSMLNLFGLADVSVRR